MWYSIHIYTFLGKRVAMSEEFHTNNEMDYIYFDGNRFLIDRGVLKDVQVESEVNIRLRAGL